VIQPRVLVLGGGPAGVGAAYCLRKSGRVCVTLLEQNQALGGNAGSFELWGHRLDYGSHRLHPACNPEVLADIKSLLGDDLLDRPRHGRILLKGRYLGFPLKPIDLLVHVDRKFLASALFDAATRPFATKREDSFADVLRYGLGRTLCEEFYFPYARKIWGIEPDRLSAIQAKRRVSASGIAKLVRKMMAMVPGFKKPGSGRFYYPRLGFGQISESYARAATALGAEILNGWKVVGCRRRNGVWEVNATCESGQRTFEAEYLWSTLPINLMAQIIEGETSDALRSAARDLRFRAMILIYLKLPFARFSEFDAHYFPGSNIRITRMSEPKNYRFGTGPENTTVLCAELPCQAGDETWNLDESSLAALVKQDLKTAGLPWQSAFEAVSVRRLMHAYPVYERGYERHLEALDRWASGLPGFLSFGRQGLFAHDNTHHALYMAYCACKCMEDTGFDLDRWRGYRAEFESHVVED
jgi:protoporphyrinogen oxidase